MANKQTTDRPIEKWVTVNGVHIPIYSDVKASEHNQIVNYFKKESKNKTSETKARQNKYEQVSDNLTNVSDDKKAKDAVALAVSYLDGTGSSDLQRMKILAPNRTYSVEYDGKQYKVTSMPMGASAQSPGNSVIRNYSYQQLKDYLLKEFVQNNYGVPQQRKFRFSFERR